MFLRFHLVFLYAEAAVKYAVRLAEDSNSRLVFLHAFRLLQTIPSVEKSPLSIKEEWNTDTADKFNMLQERFLKETKVKYECVTEIGFADDSIQSCAKGYNASLIVIGASGEGRWAGVYGSTTISVINNSTIPVIVIPSAADYVKVCHVAFAYDFKPIKYKDHLQSAVNFFGTRKVTFEVLNISEDGITNKQKQKETYHLLFTLKLAECFAFVSRILKQSQKLCHPQRMLSFNISKELSIS